MSAAPRQGIPFVVAAPSGTGKTTVCRAVVGRDPEIQFSVSHTTRPRRPGEHDGTDYHFVTSDAFDRLIAEDALLEWAEYNHHRYGTSRRAVDESLSAGRDVLLEIEIQGALQVRQRRADARFIFLLPPSMAVLEGRLRGRRTESEEQIAGRVSLAEKELEAGRGFLYAIINDDLERCVDSVLEVIRAERVGQTVALRRRFRPEDVFARFQRADGAV